MNWLSIGVIAGFIVFLIHGYRKGFIRMAYSLVAIMLSIALVSIITPYVKEALLNNTTLYEKLTDKCTEALEKRESKEAEESKKTESKKAEESNGIMKSGDKKPLLPSAVDTISNSLIKDKLVHKAKQAAGASIAMWILCVISYVGSMIAVWVIMNFIEGALDLVSRLPVIHGMNQLMGTVTGAIEGLLVFWLLCIILTAFCLEESCRPIFEMIQESQILSFLYENNGIIYLSSYFLM